MTTSSKGSSRQTNPKTTYLYKREHGLFSLLSFSLRFSLLSLDQSINQFLSCPHPCCFHPLSNQSFILSPVQRTLLSKPLRLQLRHILLRQQPRVTLALAPQQTPKRIRPIQQIYYRAVL